MNGRHPTRPWSVLFALYLAFLAVKPLYAVIVALVPAFLRLLFSPLAEILGTPVATFHAGPVWLVFFVLLTILTITLALHYANEAVRAPARMERGLAVRFAIRKLVVAWVLLDSISFYGVASKMVGYANIWCYGFVVVSAFLTVAAGWPLLTLRKEPVK